MSHDIDLVNLVLQAFHETLQLFFEFYLFNPCFFTFASIIPALFSFYILIFTPLVNVLFCRQ